MGRKSKEQIELEARQKASENKTKWIIIGIISLLLMFFAATKMGPFGIITNNILTYIFGSLFLCLLLTLFAYGIFATFLSHKLQKSYRVIFGLFVLNITVMLFSGYWSNTVNTFPELLDFIINNFLKTIVTDGTSFGITGGILGGFFYVLSNTLVERQGTILVLISMFIISLILVIPPSLYRKWWDDFKASIENNKQARRQAKELRKQEEEKKALEEEARKLQLAEEFARMNEVEEIEIPEEPLIKEEKKEDHSNVLSTKSKFFINLDEKEKSFSPEEEKKDIVQVASETTPRVLKPTRNSGSYRLPPVSLLNPVKGSSNTVNKVKAKENGEKVIEILKTFDIEAALVNTYIGPSVTKFEIKPHSTVKINRIQNIQDNIKMELAAKQIRIEAPIPGRSAVGIEIPNVEPTLVTMYELMSRVPQEFKNKPLMFALGKDLMGKGIYCDLEKMPHLLIAGETGSGKSVCENAIITSYIMRTNPDELKLVLIDPKMVEFTPYRDIPHLLWPVITDVTMASNMLKKLVVIMEERYEAFANIGVKNIKGFNDFAERHNAQLKADSKPINKLPYIVIVIDELADMMSIAGKDVELSIQRITQLARAAGIHLIVATQRPSTDVVTGLIKNNMPSRISFALVSQIDSRTILDQAGAEKLLGNGDMLYKPQEENAPIRLQGVYVTEDEVNKICNYAKGQAQPEYEDSYFEFQRNMNGQTVGSATSVNADTQDSLYEEVIEFVRYKQAASTSLLQRRFGIGYNRAARLIDTLEDKGIIGPANGSKPREVYLKKDEDQED